LSGNRFDVALRNVKTNDIAEIKEAVQNFKTNGFINYFGTQRFGKYHDTYKVGIQVLKHEFENVIDSILAPKSIYKETYQNVIDARIKWQNRFEGVEDTKRSEVEKNVAKEIISNFGRFMISELAILQSIIRKPCDYQAAFLNINRGTKLMFVHAVQSYIWNILATKRADMGHNKVIVGDLVLVEDKGKEEGGSGTSGLLGKKVEYVTKENIDKYDITDVVLPLVGCKVSYPKYEDFPSLNDLLKEIGLQITDFDQNKIRELKLGGDYRKFIIVPKDVTYEIKSYDDDTQPLIRTDVMEMNHEALPSGVQVINDLESGKKVALTVGFTLSASSYATVAMRELMKCPTATDVQMLLGEEDGDEKKGEVKEDKKRQVEDVVTSDSKKLKVGNKK